ncbi:MAG: cupin domain-containing protein, partial [Rhodococcus qingshengii]
EFLTRGEIITIVSGAMTVEEDYGDPVHLVAGTSAIFPIGWKGTWTVTETVRKVFVVYNV